jgi:O-antigen/teichoic acid export membrane protein
VQTVGKLATAVLSVVIIKYITSLETIPAYSGVSSDYKLIYTYLAFFGIIADFGLFTIAVREFAKGEKKTNYILGNVFGMRAVSIITAMLLATGVVFLIQDANYSIAVKAGVAIAAVTTAFTMLASTITSVLQEKLKMIFPTIALLLGKIIMAGYIIWVVLNYNAIPYAFYHLLLAGILGNGFVFLITYIYTYRVVPFRPRFNFDYWKEIFFKALPYGLAIILSTIYLKVDVLLLSFLRDKSEIAIYGYPASVLELIAIIPIYFMNCVLPVMTKRLRDNKEKAKKIVSYAFNFLFMCAVPIVIGGVILAKPFISLIMNDGFLSNYSTGYFGSDLAFQLVLFTLLFSFVSHLFGYILIAMDKQKKLLLINLTIVIFNIILNLILIPRFGFRGAGIATIFSQALVLILTLRESRKLIFVKFQVSKIFRILLAGVLMGLVVFPLSHLNIFIATTIGAIVYGVFILLLRVVTPAMLRELNILK